MVAGAAVVVAAVGVDLAPPAPASSAAKPPGRAPVTRTTLVRTEKVNGTLGYGDTHLFAARGGGTVTWLPAEGSIIDRGQTVYRQDNKPIPLLFGALPVYRPLSTGVEGPDVRQFEENLAAMGYRGFTVDDSYTSATADAVKQWQDKLGLDQTGRVDATAVAVAAGPVRVGEVKAAVGDPATGPVFAYTSTTRVVSVELDVAKQQYVAVGIAATVTLPDDSTVEGKVSDVGTVAKTTAGAQAQTTISVDVSVADQKALGTLDAAPVSVTLTSDRRENVLTVPIAALVALAEGGYGVQVIDATGSRYVAVKTGMFASGRVEVTGSGIAEGVMVGVPA